MIFGIGIWYLIIPSRVKKILRVHIYRQTDKTRELIV